METPTVGNQVGQYILEEKLGEGGMAEVWLARNVVLGNTVAIKFLSQGFAGRPDVEQRFLGEGKRQANLQHSNIVSAFDFLYVDGRSFLVMKYIKGESLDHRLFKLQTPMPLPAIISISKDVLSALDYAHTEGVVHRDIKPSNILLENSGRAFVMDFGIALFMREQRVTRAGMAIGTPHYMSPEQIIGSKDLDHRSDIYSYGCVLYQMLTEVPPFDFKEGEGDTEYFVKDQHLRQQARRPRDLKPDIPDYIEQVVMRALEKKPEDRFQTCHELLEALSQPAPPQQWHAPAMPLQPKTRIETPEGLAAAWGAGSTGGMGAGTVYPTAPPMTPRTTLESSPRTMPPRTTVEPAYQTAAPVVEHPQVPIYQAPTPPTYQPPPTPPVRSGGQPMILGLAGALALAGAGGGLYYWSSHRTETKPAEVPFVGSHNDTSTATSSETTLTDTHAPDGGKKKKNSSTQLARDDKRTTPTLDSQIHPPKLPPQPDPEPIPTPKPVDPVKPTPEPPTHALASGTLVCSPSSMGISRHQKQGYLFRNLPLWLTFSPGFHLRWTPEVTRKDATSKDLLLLPVGPQLPASCSEPWVEAPTKAAPPG